MFLSSYDHTFTIQATDITIVSYDRTIIMIVNNDHKTFIVQAVVHFYGYIQLFMVPKLYVP
jgi:hypothetical protein